MNKNAIPTLISILCLSICLTSIAIGQDEELQKAIKAGQPADQHKMLQKLAGEWEVVVKFKIGEKWNEGKSKCSAKMILGGRFLQQKYESKLFGKPFTVIQILGYDNTTKQFTEIHLDSMNTAVEVRNGKPTKDKKSIEFVGERTDPASDKRMRTRTVLTSVDDDHFEIAWHQTIGDANEQNTVVLKHTRKTKSNK